MFDEEISTKQDLSYISVCSLSILYNNKFIFTLVLLNLDILGLCKQCRSGSVGFWRSQLIWICTVPLCDFIATIWTKQSDWLKIRSGSCIFIYSAWQGLMALSLGTNAVVVTRVHCTFLVEKRAFNIWSYAFALVFCPWKCCGNLLKMNVHQ